MSIDVITEAAIERPVEAVSAFAGDPRNAPLWYANIESVALKTPPPIQVGSQMTFVAHFLGKRLEYTYEVIEWDAGRRLVMRTAQGPFPMETTYTWEPAGDGRTRMTLRNRGQPAGFSRLVAPFLGYAVRRANQNDLRRLKAKLEEIPAHDRTGPETS
jgi:uncharacterized membrane protein